MPKKKALRNHRRRAGTKTKLKNGNFSRFKPPQISDQTVRKNWVNGRSSRENLANLGLSSEPNGEIASRGNATPISISNASAVELFDIPDSDIIAKKTKVYLPVSIEDQSYLVKLMERHGVDYDAMARDIKRNNMQHSSHKLRKMGARFLLLTEGQIRVEVPESVRELMTSSSS